MEDNNFIEPTSCHLRATRNSVGNSISEIESNCNTSPITFIWLEQRKK
jgi:hypothetical protein